MILVGLAGWGDHDSIYPRGTKPRDKLKVYSRSFPIVEVDSSFYAIQSHERFAKWAEETPPEFQFLVKAYQGMTGHLRGKQQSESLNQMYEAFRNSIEPMISKQKLIAVLFQYPPWFDCTKNNVNILRETKERMNGIPCALEFRNRSWFEPEYVERTLAFMEQEGWIHSICDEPQAGAGSVPTVLRATHPALTIIRMHGRNVSGWNQGSSTNWREVRYLYNYDNNELVKWKDHIQNLSKQTSQICVIFNNNSGGHAADNAQKLMQLSGIQIKSDTRVQQIIDGNSEQLDLFDELK